MSTPTSYPRLERPSDGRKVAGVCAAIARHQRLDPLVVRLLAVALTLFGGLGFIAYLAGLLLIPAEGSEEPLIRTGIDGPERNMVIGFGLIAAIALISFSSGTFGVFGGGHFWWGAIALVVVALLVVRRDQPDDASSGPPPVASSSSTLPVVAGLVSDAPSDPGEAPTVVTAPVVPKRRGHSAAILGGTLLVIAATGGILAAIGGEVRWDVALCAAVIAIGVALVASAPVGGARILVPLGVLLAIMAGAAAAADLNLRGGAGDQLEHPSALAAGKQTQFNLAAGRLMVDLRDVNLLPGETKVKAEVGFGQIVVRVPDGVRVEAAGHASAGDVEMFGRDSNGFDARRSEVVPGTAATVLKIDAHAGFGQVRFIGADESLPKLSEDGHRHNFDGVTR